MIWPSVLAATSMAAAFFAGYQVFFIRGIVNVHEVTTFAILDQVMVPISPLDTTAAFADHQRYFPRRERERSIKNLPAHAFSRRAHRSTKR